LRPAIRLSPPGFSSSKAWHRACVLFGNKDMEGAMATAIREIMNPELFAVAPDDASDDVLTAILAMGVTAAPVVDGEGHPLGMVSLRDLAGGKEGRTAAERMTSPAVVVRREAAILEAAQMLAETGLHRLVVVDRDGRAVGVVSALDIVRGLMGHPASHPAAFPHLDARTGLSWTDDRVLEMKEVEAAPNGPGLLVLVHGGRSVPETMVWAEAVENVQTRLLDMLSEPQQGQPVLSYWLQRGHLRFRAAGCADPLQRERALAVLAEEMNPLRIREG
jgi:CBS domain-containing protein